MKYQKIIQAKNKLDELSKKAEQTLTELRYKAECIKQTILFMDQCGIITHEPGRGSDNGERKKPNRGMTAEILDILSVDPTPACANEILQCLHETDEFEKCTINSVSGLLCLMTQDEKVGRIKQGRSFHYFINEEGVK